MADLMEMLAEGVVLGDGGMFLESLHRGYSVPQIIGDEPQALRQIHKDYYNAGSQVLQALTWFTSAPQLEERYGWGNRMDEINSTAIRVAKEASEYSVPVGGCLVSTMTGSRSGPPVFDPEDESSHARAMVEWDEQIEVLVEAGADFLIPETFFRFDEIRVCLKSCKKVDLPTMVLLGIGSPEQTHDGVGAAECARILEAEGADVVGTVCIGDPDQMLPTTLEMRNAVDIPVACQPKGFRQAKDTEEVGYNVARYQMATSPEQMGEFAIKAKAEGINYVGACCGAGPSHIKAMAEALG